MMSEDLTIAEEAVPPKLRIVEDGSPSRFTLQFAKLMEGFGAVARAAVRIRQKRARQLGLVARRRGRR